MTDRPNDTTGDRDALRFESDPGSARSKWVAGLLVVALVGWMGSGYILPADDDAADQAETTEPAPVSVAVRDSHAETVTRIFSAEGQAQPDRRTTIRAETSGEIEELTARKGDTLEAGALIARLDTEELASRLDQAQADFDRAERELTNAQTLLDRGIATQDRLTEARSDLAAARAARTTAQEALNSAEITAPFAGRLDMLDIDPGEYVTAGAEVARILDTDPLTVTIQVPQQALSRLRTGQPAQVRFITGQEAEGEVTFVGADADSETRTFPAEITVPNGDSALASGLSAQIRIPTDDLRAHFVSPAILSLDTDGTLGVKTVDDSDTVVFKPVTIERAQTDGVWISGLDDTSRIITVGQGFVSDGETVAPYPEDEAGEAAPDAAPDPEAEPVAGVDEPALPGTDPDAGVAAGEAPLTGGPEQAEAAGEGDAGADADQADAGTAAAAAAAEAGEARAEGSDRDEAEPQILLEQSE